MGIVDWEKLGPTQGAATLVSRVRDLGHHVVDMSQGAETPSKGPVVEFLQRDAGTQLKALYNGSSGGDRALRESVAGYMRRFYRLPARGDNTFVIQQLGRNGVKAALEQAASNHTDATPVVLMPDLRWPTLTKVAQSVRLGVQSYDHADPDLARSVQAAIESAGDRPIAAVLLNFPHNPTALGTSTREVEKFMSMMDRANSGRANKIHVVFDTPYAYACNPAQDDKGQFLDTGYQNVLDGRWDTPWAQVITGSKFLTSANVGTAFIVTSDNFPPREFEARLSDTGIGIIRIDNYMANLAELLSGRHDNLLWDRKTELRAKYVANRGIAERAFNGSVVTAPANMLVLLRDPKQEVLNRAVMDDTGHVHDITNGNEFIEFAGVHGRAVPVFNGIDEGGNFMTRLALREHPEEFAIGVQRLKTIFDRVKDSPPAGTRSVSMHVPGHGPEGRAASVIPLPEAEYRVRQAQLVQLAAAQAGPGWPGAPGPKA